MPESGCPESGCQSHSQSPLVMLDPFVDQSGLLRVGGRIHKADLEEQEKHPLILPAGHRVTTLPVRHYHNKVAHQGRHFTEGALCTAGAWIVEGKRLISSIIFKCVICKKLRGKSEVQKMSNLPPNRLTMDPPFTHVGLDVFGPWSVVTRQTRGGAAESKRWAVIFACLSTRAVHLEVIDSMTTSSFINALRRFLSIQGPVKGEKLPLKRTSVFLGRYQSYSQGVQIHPIQTYSKSYLQKKTNLTFRHLTRQQNCY